MNAFAQFARKSFTTSGVNPAKAIATLTSTKSHSLQHQPVRILTPKDSLSRENSCVGSDIMQGWKLDEIKTKNHEEVPLVDFLEERKMLRAFAELWKKI